MVDMSDSGEPDYYVAPAAWMVESIRREHQQYLARRAGHRRDNDASKHCGIELRTVERWRDCWRLIDDPTGMKTVGSSISGLESAGDGVVSDSSAPGASAES
jgi:hypothetical protein